MDLRALFLEHFKGREAAEERFFGDAAKQPIDCPTLTIDREALNAASTVEFVLAHEPEVVITYGVHLLSKETLDAFPEDSWNTHGGLSPWYRGVTTHFWPSYMLEPQMTGVTLHRLTAAIDGGDVLHQTGAPLVRGDGIHELVCRTVAAYGEELQHVLDLRAKGDLVPAVKQRSSGKLWLGRDWRPEHLRIVYELYGNQIIDRYLDGVIAQRKPKLVRQPIR